MISKCLRCSKMQFKLNYISPPLHPTIPELTSTGQKAVTLEIAANKIRDTIKAASVEKSQACGAMDCRL